jgi:hypothetical protein
VREGVFVPDTEAPTDSDAVVVFVGVIVVDAVTVGDAVGAPDTVVVIVNDALTELVCVDVLLGVGVCVVGAVGAVEGEVVTVGVDPAVPEAVAEAVFVEEMVG